MMSDFMFPIYLATNKIQDQRETEENPEERRDFTETREAHGRPRQIRERQS